MAVVDLDLVMDWAKDWAPMGWATMGWATLDLAMDWGSRHHNRAVRGLPQSILLRRQCFEAPSKQLREVP
jgi:hypothetical protein